MLLMQVRASLQQQPASKAELAGRLGVTERAVEAALVYWQQQNRLETEACVSSCSSGCGKCSQKPSLRYRWAS